MNHNFIRRVEGLENKSGLQNLNLTNNWISDINQIEHLRVYCSNLKELSLKCNPIAAKKSYRPTVFQRLGCIVKLDGIALTDKDKERVKNEHTQLTREMVVEAIKGAAANKSVPIPSTPKEDEEEKVSHWEKTVETLILSHKQISRIDSVTLEQFVNLRKLQLVDNGISKIEGLGRCKLLEELSLEKNKITSIEGVNHLRYLKKLDLGRNRIRRIDGLNQLESLTQLSMEDNEI